MYPYWEDGLYTKDFRDHYYLNSHNKIGTKLLLGDTNTYKWRIMNRYDKIISQMGAFELLLEKPSEFEINGRYLQLNISFSYPGKETIVNLTMTIKKTLTTQYTVEFSEHSDGLYTPDVGLAGTFTFDTLTETPGYILLLLAFGSGPKPEANVNPISNKIFKFKLEVATEGEKKTGYRKVFLKSFSGTVHREYIHQYLTATCVHNTDSSSCI